MRISAVFLIAIALSLDCFAVAIATGIRFPALKRTRVLNMVISFGFAHILMILIGYIAGSSIVSYVSSFAHWIGSALLFAVGLRMCYEAYKEKIESLPDPSKGWLLIALAVATSIDDLAVGLDMAILKYQILLISILVGLISASFTYLGLYFGRKLGLRLGYKMLYLGGFILIGIGLQVLLIKL